MKNRLLLAALMGATTMLIAADPASAQSPGTPTGFSVSSEHCFGLHSAQWNAVSGATLYELHGSQNSDFSNAFMLNSTSGTFGFFSIGPAQTIYVRVRACNSSGCGGFSSQATAHQYYPICM